MCMKSIKVELIDPIPCETVSGENDQARPIPFHTNIIVKIYIN